MKRINAIMAIAISAAAVAGCTGGQETADGEEIVGSAEVTDPIATESDMTAELPTTVEQPSDKEGAEVTIGEDGVDVKANVPVDDKVNVKVDTTQ